MTDAFPVWSEGLFLRPQHFQAAAGAQARALHARLDGSRPYPWGVVEIAISAALGEGSKLGVDRLIVVLPDGEVVNLPANGPPPAPLDIDNQVRNEIVYLTLPATQSGTVAYAYPGASDAGIARYHIVERDVIDATDPERAADTIEVGQANLRFGIGEAALAGRTRIALGRIREVQGKRIIWDEAYIPPVLDIRASPALSAFLTDIIGRLEAQLDDLSVRAAESTQGGRETFAAYQMLQLLNRWQPLLAHLDRLDRVHPERLFTDFLAFAGELSTFSRADRRSPAFPAYDHENLEMCFKPVVEALRMGLSMEIQRSADRLELELIQPGAYRSIITDRWLYDQGRFYLAVSTLRPPEEVRRALPSVVKIGSVTRMQQLVQAALPGVPIIPVPAPPPQIRPMANFVYFELDRSSPDWKDFATAPALGLHIAGNWPELELELWCVKKESR